jgi:hypothetical protein
VPGPIVSGRCCRDLAESPSTATEMARSDSSLWPAMSREAFLRRSTMMASGGHQIAPRLMMEFLGNGSRLVARLSHARSLLDYLSPNFETDELAGERHPDPLMTEWTPWLLFQAFAALVKGNGGLAWC